MIPKRKLSMNSPDVGAIGYGAMVLEGYYGKSDDEQAVKTIQHALELGISMIDTADAYGNGHNETLIGKAIKGRRDQAFVATKFGIVFDPNGKGTEVPTGWGFPLKINGTPGYVKKCADDSLKRLGIENIDLLYAHYIDPAIPIEETIGVMAELVKAGKVKFLGLSNMTAEQIRKAHKVHPITAVQYEYSLFRREIEREILPVCKELGVGVVPWSPLGGGFLTGTVKQLDKEDFRNNNPKYSGGNLSKNQDRFAPVMKIAADLKISPAQLALAWLHHQGENIIPIPGSRKATRLDENAKAADVKLSGDLLNKINEAAPIGLAEGATLV